MKPLLKAIPSKTIVVCGAEYQVYDVVNFTGKSINVFLHGLNHQLRIRHFDEIIDEVVRLSVFYHHVSELVEKTNRAVEDLHLGDRLRFADEDSRVSTSLDKKGFLRVVYSYSCSKTLKVNRGAVHIGKKNLVTEDQIQEAIQKAGDLRMAKNQEFNKKLVEKRRLFRMQVDKELFERDQA